MNEFAHLIEKNERIVAVIKPKRAPCVLRAWIFAILYALIGIFPYVCFDILLSDGLDLMMGVIFACFMWIMAVIILLIFYLKYNSYLYCITDNKVIIRSGIIGRDFRILELKNITSIDLIVGLADKLCGNKTASIVFYNVSNSTAQSSRFLHIKHANEIYQVIRDYIKFAREK